MPRFAANVSLMFTEHEPQDRFAAAKAAGFEAVEYLHPYADSVASVREWLDAAELELILINTQVGDGAKGERGLAAVPGREVDFRAHFDRALEYATGLGAGMIHVMAGVVTGDRQAAVDTFVSNLSSAAPDAAAHGITLLLEPLNTRDVPDYLHTFCHETADLIAAIDQPNVLMQYDFYHRQVMEGDLAARLKAHFDIVGHVQFSSVPGRHEPQFGEVNLAYLFDQLDELGYAGWVGCEYTPKDGTLDGLAWASRYGIGS